MNDILDVLLEKQGINLTVEENAARDAYAMEQVRTRRNKFLDLTDKYTSPDFSLTDTQRTNILAYRKALRDLTNNVATLDWRTGVVTDVIWPTSEFISEYDHMMAGINIIKFTEAASETP